METKVANNSVGLETHKAEETVFGIIMAVSFCHLLNDTMQSLIPALYPMLKDGYALDFTQIGLLGLVFQVTASLLQPLIGIYTDKRPLPYSLSVAWAFRSSACC
jgi:FSR family fosmidomycin resistance protein-like MFS transporter